MPNLEDPDDLLTLGRLVVGLPEHWYKQPLPWCFDWVDSALWTAYSLGAHARATGPCA